MRGGSHVAKVVARRVGGVLAGVATAGGLGVAAAPAMASPVNSLSNLRNQVSITYDPTSNACFGPPGGQFASVSGEPCLSYSAVAFQLAGVTPGSDVELGGFHFQWPNTTSGQADSLSPVGQTVPVDAPLGTDAIGLLAASNAGPLSAEVDLNYTTADCNGQNTDRDNVSIPDWWGGKSSSAASGQLSTEFQMFGNAAVVPHAASVYAVSVPVDPSRKLVSVTFGGSNSNIRIFDLQPATTGTPAYSCSSVNTGS